MYVILVNGTIRPVDPEYVAQLGEQVSDEVPEAWWQAREAEAQEAQLRQAAQTALTASDIQVIRCTEEGRTLPDAWRAYRAQLRAIVSGGPGPLPERPNRP